MKEKQFRIFSLTGFGLMVYYDATIAGSKIFRGQLGELIFYYGASQVRLVTKDSLANEGNVGLTPGSGRSPGGGNGNPLQCSLPGKSHGQRSLGGYSPRGFKESYTTEHPHTHI